MNDNNQNIIKLLPDFIANQIAAGEVVQRPESVVKELIENSLDSGADSIIISVKNAGKSLIHIVDNGCGMSRQDLELSIKRHATSKVFSSEDLEEIKTFGFRGEALASVCSVSNVEIRTKRRNDEHGWNLISEPMKDIVINPVNADNGTQIFVRNLFYNVPARRKFLKSNLTEFRYISDTIIKLCLSKPNVRFTFYDDDTLIFDVKAGTLRDRISELLGNTTSDMLIPVNYQNEFLKIDGFIGDPSITRNNRSGQYFFLNGRSIQSNSLYHSVSSCYEELLGSPIKPVYILNLSIDYSKVDVNVHPQKNEVKFDDERFVYNSLKSAVLNSLSSLNVFNGSDFELIKSANPFTKISDGNSEITVNKITGEVINPTYFNRNNSEFTNFGKNYQGQTQNYFSKSAYDDIFGKLPEETQFSLEIPDDPEQIKYHTIANRFIFLESGIYIIMIDQSSFHQRIIYDKAKKFIEGKKNEYSIQELLFPLDIKLDKNKIHTIQNLREKITKLGFRFDTENDTIQFNALPDIIRSGGEEEILRKFIDEILIIENPNESTVLDKITISFAESSSITNGMKLSPIESRFLISNLKNYRIPVFSPKGKKSVIKLTSQEFYNKLFFS